MGGEAPTHRIRLAVVGGGWAGLAAAVRATQDGHHVTLIEMAAQLGGRARSLHADRRASADTDDTAEMAEMADNTALDNGQHILIGAYHRSLHLMRTVGVDIDAGLCRLPLELRYPDGRGLRLPHGPAWLAFARGVWGCAGWTARDRLALMAAAARWAAMRFRCAPGLTVDQLCAGLPPDVRLLLIDPLCVAALNTPARDASAAVLLRVLRDALFGGPGSADLLLPRHRLSALLPEPAERWLRAGGATLRMGTRAQKLTRAGADVGIGTGTGADTSAGTGTGTGWRIDGEPFDAVVLACSAHEAARLAQPHAPRWAEQAMALRYEPIATVYLQCPGARLPAPMMALRDGVDAPAQFVFDHGALGAAQGRFAFVVSGARPWVEAGVDATVAAVRRQAQDAFPPGTWPTRPTLLRAIVEKRATFRCTPLLERPAALIAPGLIGAGDYVAGPYPATLEAAVQAGEAAASMAAMRIAG